MQSHLSWNGRLLWFCRQELQPGTTPQESCLKLLLPDSHDSKLVQGIQQAQNFYYLLSLSFRSWSSIQNHIQDQSCPVPVFAWGSITETVPGEDRRYLEITTSQKLMWCERKTMHSWQTGQAASSHRTCAQNHLPGPAHSFVSTVTICCVYLLHVWCMCLTCLDMATVKGCPQT